MGAAVRPCASRAAAVRSGRGRAAGAWSGKFAPQLRRRLRGAFERQRTALAAAPYLSLDLARLDPALAHGEAKRGAEKLGVRELLAGARRPVVVEGVEAG